MTRIFYKIILCARQALGVFTRPRPEAVKWRERRPRWDNCISMPDPLICIIARSDLGDFAKDAAAKKLIQTQ